MTSCSNDDKTPVKNYNPANLKNATFAGGCFWCMEKPYEQYEGIAEAISGYTGGEKENPTYQEVSAGETKHLEAVQIKYDPALISYEDLLQIFWRQIDPTDTGGQFVDRGSQYKTAIFYHNEEQKELAQKSKKELANSGRYDAPIVTKILPFDKFYRAEEYHQDYYKKNPTQYNFYRSRSGRGQFLNEVWDEDERKYQVENLNSEYERPSDKEVKKILTDLQYKVTQEEGTEKPFDNEYWDNEEEGIYVDIVSGEPLFSSKSKYKSGTGWPSFTKPLEESHIRLYEDNSLFTKRTEVRSRFGDSHLGHVFEDGPEPTGLRYCMNSAALRFIPKENLKEEGYEEYVKLFD